MAEEKKKCLQSKLQKRVLLKHMISSLWHNGANHPEFGVVEVNNKQQIARFLRAARPSRFPTYTAAYMAVHRVVLRINQYMQDDDFLIMDPFRDRRGENRPRPKADNMVIRKFIDDNMSKTTLSQLTRTMRSRGFNIDRTTVKRISRELGWRPVAPWYTDVLTPAQKYKRLLFCRQLLRLSEEEFLRTIMGWVFSDEKWWDITGPSPVKYRKAKTKKLAMMQNQVCHA